MLTERHRGVLAENEQLTQQTIVISLEIENHYDDGTRITTRITDHALPAPSPGENMLWDWALEHVEPLNGTDRQSGNSWYEAEVTACSDPALIGRTFTFG